MPYAGRITPFVIDSAAAFTPGGPPKFGSPEYAAEFNQIKALGRDNSTVRTADQTEIAQFWAYDRPDSFRPPGQLLEAVEQVALDQGNTLEQNARLFALHSLAQADAGIVAWNTKYTYELLRPVTAIQEDANLDNNPDTVADPTWNPLLQTPPFPDYISGHSTFAGATAEILKGFYGNDNITFAIPSQELPGVARKYNSFTELAQEDRISCKELQTRTLQTANKSKLKPH